MKTIKNKIIPFGKYNAINLFGVIFYKKDISNITINHEAIHTELARDLCRFLPIGYLLFYILYMLIFIYESIANDGYYDVWFEKEAYDNQYNLNYINERKRFAWLYK